VIGVVAINVVMVLLALGIGVESFLRRCSVADRRFAQDDRYHSALPEKERMVAVIWIASMIVIGEGCFSCCSSLRVPSSKGDERIVSKFRAVLS